MDRENKNPQRLNLRGFLEPRGIAAGWMYIFKYIFEYIHPIFIYPILFILPFARNIPWRGCFLFNWGAAIGLGVCVIGYCEFVESSVNSLSGGGRDRV